MLIMIKENAKRFAHEWIMNNWDRAVLRFLVHLIILLLFCMSTGFEQKIWLEKMKIKNISYKKQKVNSLIYKSIITLHVQLVKINKDTQLHIKA